MAKATFQKDSSGVEKVHIDKELCTGCKTCVDACFLDVIRWDQKQDKPVATYPEDCVWCLACELACPAKAIEVVPAFPAGLLPQY